MSNYVKWDSKILDVDFAKTINDILKEYGEEVKETIFDVADDTAKMAKEKLQAESPKHTGKYAKSWKKETKTTRYSKSVVVYQGAKPTLTWLLESGHAKFLFGRDTGEYVDPVPHIDETNEYAQGYFYDEVLRRI